MRRHADVVQVLKQVLRNPVIEDALALDNLVFLALNAVASSLKCWIRVPGSGPSYRTLALPS